MSLGKSDLKPSDFLAQADALRGLAVLIVVWSHALHFLGDPLGLLFYQAGDLGVSIFVFISGFLLQHHHPASGPLRWRNWYTRRFRRVVLPYWLVLNLWQLTEGLLYQRWPTLPLWLTNVSGLQYFTGYTLTYYYWFITLILSLYLLFPWLSSLVTHSPWKFLAVGVTILCGIAQTLTWPRVGSFGPGVAAFILGMIAASRLKQQRPTRAFWIGLCLLMSGYLVARGSQYFAPDNLLIQTAMWTLLPFMGAGTSLIGMLYLQRVPIQLNTMLTKLGRLSYEIYLVHVVYLEAYFSRFGTTGLSYAIWFGGVLLLAEIIRKLTRQSRH